MQNIINYVFLAVLTKSSKLLKFTYFKERFTALADNHVILEAPAMKVLKTCLALLLILPHSSVSFVSASDLPIIGISTIKETVNDRRRNAKGDNFQAMLETQMAKVGRFRIMERVRVDEILAEQGLNNEFGDGKTANGGFNVGGVDYLVYGTITKLGQVKSAVSTGNFATAKLVTEMSVDLKVVDASTGEIRKAESVSASVKTASGVATGNFTNISGGSDPLSDVQRMAAKKAAALIATSIFPIEVIKGGSIVYLNYGSSILDSGDLLAVFEPGEDLIDETTGLNLGSEEKYLGKIEVTDSNDKFSKAKLLDGETPQKGSLVRILEKASEVRKSGGKAQEQKRGRKI
jgi:curli biogenesis system outer membrane secretion channel CsgG